MTASNTAEQSSRAWLGNLILVAASLTFALGVGEIFYRLMPSWSAVKANEKGHRFNVFRPDPTLSYALRAGANAVHETSRFAAPVEINQLGFRGPDQTLTKPDGTYRILLLGDSFAFGWGVSNEETFAALLEERLVANGRPVEVLNAGVPGWSADDYLVSLVAHGFETNPDLVIVAETENDPQDLVWKEYELDARNRPMTIRSRRRIVDHRGRLRTVDALLPALDFPGSEFLERRSRLWSAIRFRLNKIWLTHVYDRQTRAQPSEIPLGLARPIAALTHEEIAAGLRASPAFRLRMHRFLLDALAEACQERDIALRTLTVTFDDQSSQDPEVIAGLHRACADAPERCLDTAGFFSAQELTEAFIEGDGHWTPYGHRVVADRLADWLAAQPDLSLQRTN